MFFQGVEQSFPELDFILVIKSRRVEKSFRVDSSDVELELGQLRYFVGEFFIFLSHYKNWWILVE